MFKNMNCFKILERLVTKTRQKPKDRPPPNDDDEAAVHQTYQKNQYGFNE